MGWRDSLNSLKDRITGGQGNDYYDDDEYYDDGYDDGAAGETRVSEPVSSNGLLGNTPRPEAESVSVYTRSGRPVGGNGAGAPTPVPDTRSYAAPSPVASYTPSTSYSQGSSYSGGSSYTPTYDAPLGTSGGPTPGDLGGRTYTRSATSGQLPPYVLKPVSYDDVQTVVRRVRTNQPVVIIFKNTNIETAKRILDFCFGFSYGVNGEVSELGDRVFVVLPQGVALSDADINKLVADGDLVR